MKVPFWLVQLHRGPFHASSLLLKPKLARDSSGRTFHHISVCSLDTPSASVVTAMVEGWIQNSHMLLITSVKVVVAFLIVSLAENEGTVNCLFILRVRKQDYMNTNYRIIGKRRLLGSHKIKSNRAWRLFLCAWCSDTGTELWAARFL